MVYVHVHIHVYASFSFGTLYSVCLPVGCCVCVFKWDTWVCRETLDLLTLTLTCHHSS